MANDLPSLDFDAVDLDTSVPELDLPPRPQLTESDYAHLRKRYTAQKPQKATGKGRPAPTLDNPQVQHLLAGLEAGAFVQDAARAAGLSPRSVWRWIERGKAEAEQGTEGTYWQLWRALEAARFIAQNKALSVIMAAADGGNWRAAAWWLERAYPDHWNLHRTKGMAAGKAEAEQRLNREELTQRILDHLRTLDPVEACTPNGQNSQTHTQEK